MSTKTLASILALIALSCAPGRSQDSRGTIAGHGSIITAALAAPTFFQNASGAAKPEYQDNRYGAALGGPVSIPKLYNGKNKTFFFDGREGNQWGKPTANIGTVPTDAEKSGKFSGLLAPGSQYQIYNPLSTLAAANGRFDRTPFTGNIIPANRIDPVAKAIRPRADAPRRRSS